MVRLFAESAWDVDPISDSAVLLRQLEGKDVFVLVLHLVDDIGKGLSSSKVNSLVDGDEVDLK